LSVASVRTTDRHRNRELTGAVEPKRVGVDTLSEATARIELISSKVAVDARQFKRATDDDVDGIVLRASKIGNTAPGISDAVADGADAGILAVIAARCFDGAVAARYGGPGGSRTVREHGTIPAGDFSPRKAGSNSDQRSHRVRV
jgi:L-asparaginase/Glu-tRNA(Gln) amidotransferase subunit D